MTLIRTATLADADTIADIHTTARAAYYRGFVPDDELLSPADRDRRRAVYADRIGAAECTVLCAELDGRVAGFALLGPVSPQVGQLRQIHVRPGHWRRGLGGALHGACVSVWRARSVATGRVEVWRNNPRARAFYAAHGWRPDGHHRPGPAGADDERLALPLVSAAFPGDDRLTD